MKLSNFGRNKYSQFGEDGIIEHIFEQIGEESRFCVEFGASDGVSCSNTKRLRDADWSALLIEADFDRYKQLSRFENSKVNTLHMQVTPTTIDHLLGTRPVDLMSIDVDGEDYAIFEEMRARPRVLLVEYNGSIPPHVSVHQTDSRMYFGASARALCDLAEQKDYQLIGLTKGNVIFVEKDNAYYFADYDCRLEQLFDYESLCYFSTDFAGRPFVSGAVPPWGVSNLPFVGQTGGDEITVLTRRPELLAEAFEEIYGEGQRISADSGLNVEVPDPYRLQMLEHLLRDRPKLVVIDISNHTPDANFDWFPYMADQFSYSVTIVPSGVIAIYPRS